MIYENILDLIGKTPILKLKNLCDEECADIFVKLEKYNLTGSVKDRAALSMIEHAEKDGLLKPGSIIVEPLESPVLSGGQPGSHKIQGIGAGFIPEIYDASFVDEVITVSSEEAFDVVRKVLEKEGIFLGISSGASICAALKIGKQLGKGKKVLALSPDGGEKYMSMNIIS